MYTACYMNMNCNLILNSFLLWCNTLSMNLTSSPLLICCYCITWACYLTILHVALISIIKEKYIHNILFISALQTIYIWSYTQPAHRIGKSDSLIAVQSNTWPGTWPGPWLGIGNGWFWPPENPTYRGPSMLKQSANVVL